MKTLLFLINILGIAIASPIQRSEMWSEMSLRRGYEGDINGIYAGKGDLKNSSANENRNQESENDDDPQEGEIFLNLTKRYVIGDEVPPVNALNLQESYRRETGSLPLHSDASLMEDKRSSLHSTQANMGTYAPLPIRKAVLGHHTDLIPKSRNGEQNGSDLLRDKNAVHYPESAAEGSVTQEKEIFSDKEHIGGFQATSGFMVKKNVDVLYSEHYRSLGNYHFSDEGMQGDDPGYADDFDSSQQDQSDSNQQQGELDSPSSSNEVSKHSNTAKDSGSPNDSSSSADVSSSTDSKNSRDSSASKDPRDFSSSSDSNDSSSSHDSNDISSSRDFSDSSASKDSSDSSSSSESNDSSSSSESNDSSSSSDLNDTSSSSDSRNSSDTNDPSSCSDSSDSNRSDSSSLSDSSDSSNSSESKSSSDSGDSDSLNDSNTASTSTAYSKSSDSSNSSSLK